MRVLLVNHHTPYLRALATALTDFNFFILPSQNHAPTGWRDDQRPRPPNMCLVDVPVPIDVFIVQADTDWDLLGWTNYRGVVVLSHNRPEFEGPAMRRAMQVLGGSANGASVSISPMKTKAWIQTLTENYGGTHEQWHTVLPGIDVSDYGGWTGEGGYVLTVANNLRRPLFDAESWVEATRGLPVKLVGEGNEGIPGAVGPAKDWDHLKSLYRCARVYLSVNKWPNEDGYNLSLLEAMATRCPVVAISNPTLPDGVPHGEPWVVRASLEFLLKEPGARMPNISEQFPLDRFRQSWLNVLESVAK